MYQDIRLTKTTEGKHINDLHKQVQELEKRIHTLETALELHGLRVYECENCTRIFKGDSLRGGASGLVLTGHPATGTNAIASDGIMVKDENKERHYFCWECLDVALIRYPQNETFETVAFWLARYRNYKQKSQHTHPDIRKYFETLVAEGDSMYSITMRYAP